MRGKRTIRVDLYKPIRRASDFEADSSEKELVAQVIASFKNTSGKEDVQGDRPAGLESVEIRFRWGPGLTGIDSTWWLEKGERRWNISSVANVDERNRECVVMAVEET